MRHGGEIDHERSRPEIVNGGLFGLRACRQHRFLELGDGKLPISLTEGDQSNAGKRLYRTLNHLRDRIWSHHGQQTALLEIELSLLEFAVSITRSVHAIEVSVVRDRISRSVS